MRRVAFHNLGCKVNAYETEAMLQQLAGRGYQIVSFGEEADIYVINTCTVTNIADRKSRQMIHRAKKKNPDALVVAVGCYVQASPEAALTEGGADLIVGNDQKARLAELIEERVNALVDLKEPREYESLTISDSSEHTRAFLKIQDGCNQFCSYCLIPYVRGRVRSRRAGEVLAEARTLVAKGFREIVLTGIHLSSYGLDFEEEMKYRTPEEPYGTALLRLIQDLAGIPDLLRIRLGSLEPRIITENFVHSLAACDKVCPHFHLSLQSGSEATLRRMNRKYTPEEYYEKCLLIRKYFSHPAITTDVIVGFPGETAEEFEETRKFLDKAQFYETHIFKFSRRKGTKADCMPNQIPEAVKSERSRILLTRGEERAQDFRRYYLGRTAEVLFEEEEERNGARFLVGHTREYVKIVAESGKYEPGMVISMEISEKNLG